MREDHSTERQESRSNANTEIHERNGERKNGGDEPIKMFIGFVVVAVVVLVVEDDKAHDSTREKRKFLFNFSKTFTHIITSVR